MNAKAKQDAEALLRLTTLPEGKVFMEQLHSDYDKAMRELLFADSDKILFNQGKAQGYHYILKKFTDARKLLDS